MTVGVLGCGRMGTAFARALAAVSCPVLVAGAGRASAARLAASLSGATAVDVADLVRRAPLLVLAVPFPVALAVMAGERARIGAGRVVVDVTNPGLGPASRQAAPAHQGCGSAGSAGEALAAALPAWRVVKAFNSVPADMLAVPVVAHRPVTLPVASDHDGAKAQVSMLARRLGFDPVDAGGIVSSRELEALASLLVTISRRHRLAGRVGFQLARVEAGQDAGAGDAGVGLALSALSPPAAGA